MLAIFIELTVSANLLTFIGVPYVTDGGSLLFKLHPGTQLILLSFVLLMIRRGSWPVIVSQKMLMTFLGLIASCLAYSFVLTGIGNIIVLLDTFLPAGLLALTLTQARPTNLQLLRRLMQSVLAANAFLALAETVVHATLIPLYLNDLPYHSHTEDFRPTALFDHPLTGSVMVLIGLTLAPRQGWYKVVYLGLMWGALLAYGGRVAMLAAIVVTSGYQASHTGRLVLRRQPGAGRNALATTAIAISALLLAATALSVGLGTRIAGHLYWDDSAQVRLAQWHLIENLNSWQLLFGTRRDDLIALLVPLRLGTGVEVIENFWLLMFVGLGLCGFPLFLGALLTLFAWCWRRSLLQGRLLLFGVLLVTSTNNSIGRKSTILVCMVASIACMPARRSVGNARADLSRAGYGLAAA